MPQGLPLGYDVKGNPIYAPTVGSAMGMPVAQAPPPPVVPPPSPVTPPKTIDQQFAALAPGQDQGQGQSWLDYAKNFGKGFTESVILPALEMGARGGDPTYIKNTIASAVDAHIDQYKKAKEAYQKGDGWEAYGHGAAAALPIIGPAAAGAGELIGTGDPAKMAEGFGQATGLVAPFIAHEAAGRIIEKAKQYSPAVADMAEKIAANRVTNITSPKGGPKRAVFAKMAEKSAREFLRDPDMKAWSRLQLEDKVHAARIGIAENLNDSYATMPQEANLSLEPVKQDLMTKIKDLMVEGARDSGKTLSQEWKNRAELPFGDEVDSAQVPYKENEVDAGGKTSVMPSLKGKRAQALNQALSEVETLGDRISGPQLRKLAMTFNDGAEQAYLPKTAPDYLAHRAEGQGWADAEQVLRDYAIKEFPHLKPMNARYGLMKTYSDVLAAAADFERGKSTDIKRGALAAAAGSVAGAYFGHGSYEAVALGAVLGPILDSTLSGGVTSQIGVARALTRFADSLRDGKISRAQDALFQATRTSGAKVTMKGIKDAFTRLKDDESGSVPGDRFSHRFSDRPGGKSVTVREGDTDLVTGFGATEAEALADAHQTIENNLRRFGGGKKTDPAYRYLSKLVETPSPKR